MTFFAEVQHKRKLLIKMKIKIKEWRGQWLRREGGGFGYSNRQAIRISSKTWITEMEYLNEKTKKIV